MKDEADALQRRRQGRTVTQIALAQCVERRNVGARARRTDQHAQAMPAARNAPAIAEPTKPLAPVTRTGEASNALCSTVALCWTSAASVAKTARVSCDPLVTVRIDCPTSRRDDAIRKTRSSSADTCRGGAVIYRAQPPSNSCVRSRKRLISASAPPEAMTEANSSRRKARSLTVPFR